MSDKAVGMIALIFSVLFIVAAIGGCFHRAEAVLAYNPGAPV